MIKRTIRAVTLDAGDTLIELVQPVGEVYAKIAARHGSRLSAEKLQAAFAGQIRGMWPLATEARGISRVEFEAFERSWWAEMVERVFSAVGSVTDMSTVFDEIYKHFASAGAWQCLPRARTVLRSLAAAGLGVAIVSDSDSRLPGILEGLGLSSWIDVIVYSSQVGVQKPDPAIFRVALDALEVEASATLHVGDNAERDWEGARAAGMQALLFDPHGLYTDGQGMRTITSLMGVLKATGVRPVFDPN